MALKGQFLVDYNAEERDFIKSLNWRRVHAQSEICWFPPTVADNDVLAFIHCQSPPHIQPHIQYFLFIDVYLGAQGEILYKNENELVI